ncbi:MAG: RIP metalloprotease RseP [Pseudomonadota bacterium]|nr:RIP metalloprotease RseP [Pseudomonadota bacterium]
MITTIIATIVALGVLVTVHEFGHYWVAKRCGVRVLRFSVGFGRALYTWKDQSGTEFCVAAIPLGGYVKMLDGREKTLAEEERTAAFDQKTVGQRFAIVAAGPGINFIFAAIVYALISMIGVQTPIPVAGELPGETATKTRLPAEIVSFDGRPMESWERISIAMVDVIGDQNTVQIGLRPLDSSVVNTVTMLVPDDLITDESPLVAFGVRPWSPPIHAELARVIPGGAGEAAGLLVGDRVTAVNGKSVADWSAFVAVIKGAYGLSTDLTVERAGLTQTLTVVPETREGPNGPYGFLGVAPVVKPLPPELMRTVQENPVKALWVGIERTIEMSWLTIESIGKMISGALSPENLSGPLTIARVAGDSASSGWYAYLSFIAYLSVSLGVLNLLPIPVLDGGHLVFFAVEWLRGKPVSEQVQMQGIRIGVALLMGLMFFAFYNDLMRL